MLKNIKLIIKDVVKTITVGVTVFIISISGIYYFSSAYFLNFHNSSTVNTIFNDIQNNIFLEKKYYNIETELEVEFQNKLYTLVNQKFEVDKKTTFNDSIFSFTVLNNTEIHFPYYVEYSLNDIIIRISLEHGNKEIMFFAAILLFIIFVYTSFYHITVYKKMKSLHSFKISAQEYALSERTTSYLISIMHHKLNTPLKVLSTKSRVLAQTIFDNIKTEEILIKAQKDYVNINNALDTIFKITEKLKIFQSASTQMETNIYNLFNISKNTIEVLRDDELSMNIDRRTKLFEINEKKLTPHDIIQVFINQIKFSIGEMSTEINVKLFYYDNTKIKILFSDNGNPLDKKVLSLLKSRKTFDTLDFEDRYEQGLDLLLNLSILTEAGGNLRVLDTNENGTTYEIIIPTTKIDLNKLKEEKKKNQ